MGWLTIELEAARPKVEPSPRAEDEDPSPSPPIEDMGWCMEGAEAKPPAPMDVPCACIWPL